MSTDLEEIENTDEVQQDLTNNEVIVAEKNTPSEQSKTKKVLSRKRGGLRKPYVKFTIAMQRKFLKEFEKVGNIAGAAARIGVDRKTVYNERNKNPAFAQALEVSKETLSASLETYAIDRVMNGETIVKTDGDGNVIETITKPCSPAFAMKVLETKTESYAKTTETVNTDSDEHAVLKKLLNKLGVTSPEEKLKAAMAKEIEGEVIDGEFTEE